MFEKLEMWRLFAAWVHPDVGYFDESTKTVYLFGTTLADTFIGELLPSGYNRLSAYFSRNNVHVASYGPDVVNGLVIDAGAGNDVLNISVSASGQGHALSTTLLGGNGNDSIRGGNGPDSIAGGDGDDTLHGLDGNDTIIGAGGKDLLLAGYGPTDYQGGRAARHTRFCCAGFKIGHHRHGRLARRAGRRRQRFQ
jgi:Ca2+-binding RTX toxin-like protein